MTMETGPSFSRCPAHSITAGLRNSVPLSKSNPVTSNGTSSTEDVNLCETRFGVS